MIRIVFEAEKNRAAAYDGEKEVGECTFISKNDHWVMNHTVVDPSYGGQGIAKKLVAEVILEARKEGKKIHPTCSYVKTEFERVLEYRDLLV